MPIVAMYTFQQKRDISRRIASISLIGEYRRLLRLLRHPMAGRKMLDKRSLAVSLVYDLLDSYTEEQLLSLRPFPADALTEVAVSPQPVASVSKLSKFEQYPHVRWMEMDDPLVRTADAIFTDRVNLYRRLREIEKSIGGDYEADPSVLEEFVRKSVRLEMCCSELASFDATGKFIGRHPFIKEKDERSMVMELLRGDPEKYFEQRKNIELNIARYSSYSKSGKNTQREKDKAVVNLERHKAMLAIYKEVFDEFVKSK